MSKNRDEVIKQSISHIEGYTVVPNLLWSMPVSNNAKLIYCYLISRSENFNPGYKVMRIDCGLGNNSIQSAIHELCMYGMISLSQSNGSRNFYVLSDLDEWQNTPSNVTDFPISEPENHADIVTVENENRADLVTEPCGSGNGTENRTVTETERYRADLVTVPLLGSNTPNNKPNKKPNKGEEKSSEPKTTQPSPSDSSFPKKEKTDEPKKDIPSFRTMVSLLQSQNGNKIPKPHELVPFVSSCKDQGLSVDDINVRAFSSAFFDGAKSLKKKIGTEKFNDWREQIENQLEQAKATVYFAGSLNMNSEPEIPKGKIVINHRGESVLHEETFDALFGNFISEE